MDECNQHALYLNHMFIHIMYNYSDEVTKSRRDEVWIGQPDSQRTVDIKETSCIKYPYQEYICSIY